MLGAYGFVSIAMLTCLPSGISPDSAPSCQGKSNTTRCMPSPACNYTGVRTRPVSNLPTETARASAKHDVREGVSGLEPVDSGGNTAATSVIPGSMYTD